MNNQKIHVLPNNLINQIAAGEVVERPASILKELLDNSIDAGATQIKIYIEDVGLRSLKIIDNGCGMIPEDAKTAFLPHSTSKIKDEKDLENILTLGFRGEALASISSVSKVNLITKTSDSISGFKIVFEGGDLKEEGEIGATDGTSILINDIFFNTPARRKFLKTPATELRHLLKMFTDISLANPQISFELYHNDKQIFALPKTENLKERIRNLIGEDFTKNAFEIYYDGIIGISGWAGLPKIATERKSTQIMIVNGRPISSPIIIAAIKDAYHSAMPKNLYPQFVINIKLDPSKVDVNVHPRKLEVRFDNEQEIFRAVKDAVRAGLEKALQQDTKEKLQNVGNFSKTEFSMPSNLNVEATSSKNSFQYNNKPFQNQTNRSNVNDSLNFTKSLFENVQEDKLPWEEEKSNQMIIKDENSTVTNYPAYQLLNAYIVTTNGTAIQIIDQHAAAERVNYERLKKEFENEKIQKQALLIPFELNLNATERLILIENSEYLKSFGLEIEEFGTDSLVVREVPIELAKADLNLFIKELLNDIANKENEEQGKLEKRKDHIIATMACHASIRVGDPMTKEQIDQTIMNLKKCEIPYSCPHGRPIIYEIPISELEKKFKRK